MASLGTSLLSEEIRSINARRRSGILEVSSAEGSKGIFFRAGQIVFASSAVAADKLGENLIRLGRISRAEFAAAYRARGGRRRRLGQALVGAGLLSEEEIGRLVARQVETIILSLFTWTSGEMRFHEGANPIPTDLALDLSTHRLIFEGVRVFPDEGRLELALGSLERRLRPVARPPFDLGRAPLALAERTALEEAAEGARIMDILAGPIPRALLVRATYALVASGVLEDAAEAEPVSAEAGGDTGTFQLAMASSPLTATADPRAEVLRLYEAMPRATHYEVLGVSPDATLADVTAAYERLCREQDAGWKALADDLKLASMVSTLQIRRREAHQALSDSRRRAAYDHSLGAMTPAPTPEPAPEPAPAPAPATAADLVRQAEKLQERREGDRALPLLMKAVELDPRHRPARRLLAIALAHDPALSRTAERHFLAALEQDPADVDLRYRLALYYKKTGFPARAVLHLKLVLGKDPDHAAAWRELAEIEGGKGRPR